MVVIEQENLEIQIVVVVFQIEQSRNSKYDFYVNQKYKKSFDIWNIWLSLIDPELALKEYL